MEKIIKLVSDYEIIGLGEATHGNYKNSKFRVNVIKRLITYHGVREIFFEADVFRVKMLNTMSGNSLHVFMNKMSWVFDNQCTRELLEYIHTFNTKNAQDKVVVYGVDVQAYRTENDVSDNTALGKTYKKWGKYLNGKTGEMFQMARNKSMGKLFEEQHKDGRKAVLIFHNFHLNKSEKYKDMGYYIYKLFKDKYICVANTFTKGTYHGLFISNKKMEFQDVEIDIPNTEYLEEKPVLYYPPPNYIFEGSAQVDNRYPNKYFTRISTNGWDAVLCINNETPLVPYSKNEGVQYFIEISEE